MNQLDKDLAEEFYRGMKARGITGVIIFDTPKSSIAIVQGRVKPLQKMLVRAMHNSPGLVKVITGAMEDYFFTKKQDYDN